MVQWYTLAPASPGSAEWPLRVPRAPCVRVRRAPVISTVLGELSVDRDLPRYNAFLNSATQV